jgi:hypothetical protein
MYSHRHPKNKTKRRQKGGGNYNYGGWGYGVPVGAPLNQGDISTWGKSNYYGLSPTGINVGGYDPAVPSNSQFGGVHKKKNRKARTRRRTTRAKKSYKKSYKKSTKKTNKKSYKMRGGGLLTDFTNLGREMTSGIGRLYDTYSGNLSQPDSYPSPTNQPLYVENSNNLLGVPYKLPDIRSLHSDAGRYVAGMR